MICGRCGHGVSYVKDTRRVGPRGAAPTLKRRRECAKCQHAFTTYEVDGEIWASITSNVLQHAAAVRKRTERYWRDSDIVERVRKGEKRYMLAAEYGIAGSTVSHITRKAGIPAKSRGTRQ